MLKGDCHIESNFRKSERIKTKYSKNEDVRPTTDRVKESLFNMINSYIMESEVLDLFAGTGSLGIECLSRGAKSCTFVDISKESIDIVKSNVKKARVESESIILNLDFKTAIDKLKLQNSKFDIIFMDPPYYKNMFIEAIEKIDNSNLLNEDGIIVVEHDTNDLFPDKICKLEKTRDKKYGNTTLTFYKMEA